MKAYTLIEIIIVVVIVGVIAGLLLPRMAGQLETGKFNDAVATARALQGAQQRYYLDRDVYSADCNSLDVASRLKASDFTVTCRSNGSVYLARVGGPVYTLIASPNGGLSCSPPGTCPIDPSKLSP